VSEANKADALKDEDGNGIADVDELDATRFFLRKVNLMLVSVNPETLSEATKYVPFLFCSCFSCPIHPLYILTDSNHNTHSHLYMAAVAIVAALKLRFARAVALGNSLGDIAADPAKRFVVRLSDVFFGMTHENQGAHTTYTCIYT
jgi:hypothetical protein